MGRRAGLICLLAISGWGDWYGLAQQNKDKESIPADLARVSGKYAGLVTVRVADLWNGELGKNARGKAGKEGAVLEKELRDRLGMSPADVKRVTFAIQSFEGQNQPVMLVGAGKAVNRKSVLAALVPGAKEEKHGQWTLYVKDNTALVFLGDRAYAMGAAADVQSLLDGKAEKGGLDSALQAAMDGKQSLVVGVNGEALPPLPNDVPADLEPFTPLWKVTKALLTANVGDKLTAELRVSFPGEKDAKSGSASLEAGRKAVLGFLDAAVKRTEKDKETAGMVALLKQLTATLKQTTPKMAKNEVTASLVLKIEPEATSRTLAEMVVALQSAAARMKSANNLKQIGLAFHNYHDVYSTFPAQAIYDKNGKALLSWRVAVLPFVEQDQLYKEFKLDEPWDSKHNKKLLERMPPVYKAGKPAHPHGTFYQVFAGKGAIFEGKKGIVIAAISDGTSNTILAIEAAKDVPWSKPEDVPFDEQKAAPKFGAVFPKGGNALFADGSVRFLSETIKANTLKALITRSGGEVIQDD